ncbi:MAG: cystathionine beta-synthase [Chlorobi bacterium OLB4]|jgi:Cysteine synthase|nr:MAG: cystathionine beta-synthase [Chlorobi bacterium OLB4]MBW7855164.1 cysteine synthase [Ignavibacteria bacterium]OQY77916.1 MAG: cystathionine beta-synthase [Ignavibacteriales bacterium UTCHB1]
MKFYNNITELFGNTPLVKLNKLTTGIKATVLAKLESFNPGGSVKDRIGYSMIKAAEEDGTLKPGGTIVESTSGNTGIGLALAASQKGYKCIFVMTEKVSNEKRNLLKALGADIVIQPMTAKYGDPEHYVIKAIDIASKTPNAIYINQYGNPSNPKMHYDTTGPEIWRDTDGKVTHFVAGIGTGGTISGTGRFLKDQNPNIKVIGADPLGSIFKTLKDSGVTPEPIPYLIEGIGQDILPDNVDFSVIDEIINVPDDVSVSYTRLLTREEGIFCGGSTGTIVYTALQVAKKLSENDVVVFIVCDTGERYLSKYHSEKWLREKRLLKTSQIDINTIITTKHSANLPPVISVASGDPVYLALEKIDANNISTIPVIDDGVCTGSVRESDIIKKIMDDRTIADKPVSSFMSNSLPAVDKHCGLSEALNLLKSDNAILVTEFGKVIGIVTRYDVLDFV